MFGSALHANYWYALWIYFIAPTLGMLAAGEVFLRVGGGGAPYCAKLHHENPEPCMLNKKLREDDLMVASAARPGDLGGRRLTLLAYPTMG